MSKNKKNIKVFPMKFSIFDAEKNLCILHGRVFVMTSPGGQPGGKSVPGSHKRCDTQSSDISAEEIRESCREVLPVPDSHLHFDLIR